MMIGFKLAVMEGGLQNWEKWQADLINKFQSACTEKLRKVEVIRLSDAADMISQLRKVLISAI